MNKHELYMQRAHQLAKRGGKKVRPNPLVGCVIVHQDKIISEGWHEYFGGPHAEVNAINKVKNKNLLQNSTLFINLEPCNHYGKTPPCTQMIVKSGIKNIVIASKDPNPLVNGKGIEFLKNNNLKVETGVCEEESQQLNLPFFTFIQKKRPFIILKWAQTKDGFIAKKNFDSKWISSVYSRQLAHKFRTEADAILVGKNTVLYDNPQLNVRDWFGENPIRVLIDNNLQLKDTFHIFDKSQKTICYNLIKNENNSFNLEYIQLDSSDKNKIINFILNDLYIKKIMVLLVEGGAELLNSFIKNNLWDEIRLFESSKEFEEGIPAPIFDGTLIKEEFLFDDRLKIYTNYKQ